MSDKDFLVVSEKFYSIQGEGKSAGKPAVFLRLAGCNILCKSDSWTCDTIEVWKKGVKEDFEQVLKPYVNHLRKGVRLVVTGGEPLLHQKKLASYFEWFLSKYGFTPIIEIETNGTILPEEALRFLVNQWNVSPKLSNSGESKEKRYKEDVLKVFTVLNTQFKFVVSIKEDINEIQHDFAWFMNKNQIYLMPAGETREQLNNTREIAVELCKKHFYNFTDRQHIVIWDKKTGV